MFFFKGTSSEEMGVIAEEENFQARAALRYEEIVCDGLNGSRFNVLGYDNVSIPLKIFVLNKYKVDDILNWLTGSGTFEYEGRITEVSFFDSIVPMRTSNIKVIETTFIRNPFWYHAHDTYQKVNDLYIFNDGNTESQPIIKLCGTSGTIVDLTIGGIRFTYTFDACGYVEIDCEHKTEIAEGMNKSSRISIGFDYPRLKMGKNDIIINRGNPTIYIKRKDRWL